MARYGVRGRGAKSAGAARTRAAAPGRRAELPRLYRGAKSGRALRDIYASEHGDQALGGRFRWLISTCLAGAIGALAIVVVIYGSSDHKDNTGGLLPSLRRMGQEIQTQQVAAGPKREDGLKWSVPRTDKLEVTSGATSTRYVIHETLKEKRAGREYIYAKPYMRMVLRMAPVPVGYEDVIPPFNPFKLYGNTQPVTAREDDQELKSTDVSVRVVELLGGILPGEDGQELDTAEVTEIVDRTESGTVVPSLISTEPDSNGDVTLGSGEAAASSVVDAPEAPFTSVLQKTAAADDDSDEIDGLKRIITTAGDGDTISKILTAAGASQSLARSMIEAGRELFADAALKADYEVHIVVAPTLADSNRLEPVRFSVFDEGHAHKISVARSAAGEFVASADPIDDEAMLRAASAQSNGLRLSSLYSSLYAAALLQQVPTSTITQILGTHARDADFKRRIRPGDSLELFFDLKDDLTADGTPGDLLYTALTAGGTTKRFYRFRTPDGVTDLYDDTGSNARSFLLRQTVRSTEARITSFFGWRFHPLLNERKLHTGVDWAAPTGTPIMAAGGGTVEDAGRKGQYGNYIRIRHVNGYQTAYGHLSRIADGVVPGAKVRQGQTIGSVGSTGLSSGPHLHFEVLINNQFVNPTTIQSANEKQLKDRELEEFQKERARIDDLKARPPVATSTKSGSALNK
jgi:murein DD-endopeptidase MepM/ murein hydrolase activator NlpD